MTKKIATPCRPPMSPPISISSPVIRPSRIVVLIKLIALLARHSRTSSDDPWPISLLFLTLRHKFLTERRRPRGLRANRSAHAEAQRFPHSRPPAADAIARDRSARKSRRRTRPPPPPDATRPNRLRRSPTPAARSPRPPAIRGASGPRRPICERSVQSTPQPDPG